MLEFVTSILLALTCSIGAIIIYFLKLIFSKVETITEEQTKMLIEITILKHEKK